MMIQWKTHKAAKTGAHAILGVGFLPAQFGKPIAVVWTSRGTIQVFSITGLPAGQTYWHEATLRATAGTVRARVMNKTTSVAVTGSEISTTAAVKTRVRSAGAITLADGAEYESQTGMGPGDAGFGWGAQAIPVP